MADTGARRVVLLGAPGAGKGTQASRMATACGLLHFSTGDLLRSAVAAGTPAGKAAAAHMQAGRLVPDETVFGVLFERLPEAAEGFVLDGFPRNLAQAEELDRRLALAGTPLDKVIDLDVPDSRLVARLAGRRVCPACGASFHLEFRAPAVAGRCDGCDAALIQRGDDSEAVVAERLAVYHRQTAPLVRYYAELGLLVRVDGDRAIEQVTRDLLARLLPGSASAGRGA